MMIQKFWAWVVHPPVDGPRANLLIRLMAGSVLLLGRADEVRLLEPGRGTIHEARVPVSGFTAHFVGGLEIGGGIMLMLGLGTRLIAIPFIVEMLVAMLSTKPGIFLGTSPLPLPPAPPQIGLWAVLHEIRSEYAQLVSSLFLLLTGPGPLSLDATLLSEEEEEEEEGQPTSAGAPVVRPPFRDDAATVSDRRRVSGG